MMVVIYFSKKRLNEATRAWIDTSLFGSLLQIVSTTHKKISKPRHTSYSAHRRSISWRRPCFCRRSFLHLTDFSYFSSIILCVHCATRQSSWRPPGSVRTRRPSQCVGLSAESLSWWALLLLILWACCMLQVYGVIMGLNVFCNPFFRNKLLKSYHTVVWLSFVVGLILLWRLISFFRAEFKPGRGNVLGPRY